VKENLGTQAVKNNTPQPQRFVDITPAIIIGLIGIIAYKFWVRSHTTVNWTLPTQIQHAQSPNGPSPESPNGSSSVPKEDRPFLPNPELTPGSVFVGVSAAQVCVPGYARSVRNVPHEEKLEVYHLYQIPHHKPRSYEIDHLVSLELGGDNTMANLWPQPYEGQWGAHTKDRLENELHRRVCNGSMPLAEAQREIYSDWVATYRKYLGTP